MSQRFASDYIDVATRIAEFREKYPDGSLQPANLEQPFDVLTIAGETYIAYTAAAYRTPDDPRPGVGCAYELVPGKTNFTKGSELQNAETSAWGRAIVAALAADTRKGIASAEEIRNRHADQTEPLPDPMATEDQLQEIDRWLEQAGPVEKGEFMAWRAAQKMPGRSHLTSDQAERVIAHMRQIGSAGTEQPHNEPREAEAPAARVDGLSSETSPGASRTPTKKKAS